MQYNEVKWINYMPYSGPNDSKIPSHVPAGKKSQWVKVWNSAYSECVKDGGSTDTCEGKAFKIANGVIKKSKEIEGSNMDKFREFMGKLQGLISDFTGKSRAMSLQQVYEIAFGKIYERELSGWLSEIYRSDTGEFFAILIDSGKLFKIPLEISGNEITLGETEEVVIDFNSVNRGYSVVREADGRLRWVSVSCTSVVNKDLEIDSTALFDSFADHVERTGKYPFRTFFHKGEEFRTGMTDFVARDGNVLITSGLYDDSQLARLEVEARQADPKYWGESISYFPTADPDVLVIGDGVEIPVYRSGVLLEISTLPNRYASSFFTNKTFLQEVSRAMKPREKEAFLKLFKGDEEAMNKWLEENVEETNRSIVETGAITREASTEEPVSEVPVEEPAPEPEETPVATSDLTERTLELDEEAVLAIAAAVIENPQFINALEEMRTSVASAVSGFETLTREMNEMRAANIKISRDLSERLELVERSANDVVNEAIADLPRNTVARVMYRPSRPQNSSEDEPEESLEDVAKRTLALFPHP